VAHRDGMSIRELARCFHHSRYKIRGKIGVKSYFLTGGMKKSRWNRFCWQDWLSKCFRQSKSVTNFSWNSRFVVLWQLDSQLGAMGVIDRQSLPLVAIRSECVDHLKDCRDGGLTAGGAKPQAAPRRSKR
jgi:hypothetical protein